MHLRSPLERSTFLSKLLFKAGLPSPSGKPDESGALTQEAVMLFKQYRDYPCKTWIIVDIGTKGGDERGLGQWHSRTSFGKAVYTHQMCANREVKGLFRACDVEVDSSRLLEMCTCSMLPQLWNACRSLSSIVLRHRRPPEAHNEHVEAAGEMLCTLLKTSVAASHPGALSVRCNMGPRITKSLRESAPKRVDTPSISVQAITNHRERTKLPSLYITILTDRQYLPTHLLSWLEMAQDCKVRVVEIYCHRDNLTWNEQIVHEQPF